MKNFLPLLLINGLLPFVLICTATLSFAEKKSTEVKYFFSIPRPEGATLKLLIDKKQLFEDNEEDSVSYQAILDYWIRADSVYIRIHILNGDMTNQRILFKLGKNEEYYIYHPILGLNAISRIQMHNHLVNAGFNLNDLITALDPSRGTDIKKWSGKTSSNGFIVYSADNKLSCRDEYHFSSFTPLPNTIWLCQDSKKKQLQIQLTGEIKLQAYTFPKNITYIENGIITSEIRITPTTLNTWKNPDHYSKDKLDISLHPSLTH